MVDLRAELERVVGCPKEKVPSGTSTWLRNTVERGSIGEFENMKEVYPVDRDEVKADGRA